MKHEESVAVINAINLGRVGIRRVCHFPLRIRTKAESADAGIGHVRSFKTSGMRRRVFFTPACAVSLCE